MNHADPGLRTALEKIDAFEGLVADLWRQARAAWPELTVDADGFAAGVAERVEAQDAESQLARLRADDLYLALGCEAGEPKALAAFERSVLPAVDPALLRIAASEDERQEARQRLMDRLFVGVGGRPPKIVDYAGRGKLTSWLQVAAVRILHNVRRADRRVDSTDDDAMLERLLPLEDPILAPLKDRYRAEFKAAFAAAVDSLPPRDRTLLRQHWVDGLASDQLGTLYDVHRATASRWVVKAQDALAEATRSILAERLQLEEQELQSVIRLIQSRFEASVHRLLAEDGHGPGDET